MKGENNEMEKLFNEMKQFEETEMEGRGDNSDGMFG
jgi:hypothetical protein